MSKPWFLLMFTLRSTVHRGQAFLKKISTRLNRCGWEDFLIIGGDLNCICESSDRKLLIKALRTHELIFGLVLNAGKLILHDLGSGGTIE